MDEICCPLHSGVVSWTRWGSAGREIVGPREGIVVGVNFVSHWSYGGESVRPKKVGKGYTIIH